VELDGPVVEPVEPVPLDEPVALDEPAHKKRRI
jgi:hypothetical protein